MIDRHAPERTQSPPIGHTYPDALDEAALRRLSAKLLDDLKEAQDQLKQGPDNRPQPPGSRAPWKRRGGGPESDATDAAEDGPDSASVNATPARTMGKQPGAPGIGQTQVFQAHDKRPHYSGRPAPDCGLSLDPAMVVAYTGFQAVDLRWNDPVRPGLTRGPLSIAITKRPAPAAIGPAPRRVEVRSTLCWLGWRCANGGWWGCAWRR